MEIQSETLKRCLLVTVSGRIDSARAPDFEHTLLGLIEAGARNVVVNLQNVDFISSAGLATFIRARIRLRKRIPSGELVISEASPDVVETFELVGLHHVFQFYDRDLDAVAQF